MDRISQENNFTGKSKRFSTAPTCVVDFAENKISYEILQFGCDGKIICGIVIC